MDEVGVNALCQYLEAVSVAIITMAQKADAIEALLKKRPEFAEAYRQELERTKARGQQSKLASNIRTLQSILNRKT